MGLFVVGRLAARHGVRVRLRHAQVGGLTALIWLPDTVAAPEVAAPLGRLRRFEAEDFGPAPSLSAPPGGLAKRRVPGHRSRQDTEVLTRGADGLTGVCVIRGRWPGYRTPGHAARLRPAGPVRYPRPGRCSRRSRGRRSGGGAQRLGHGRWRPGDRDEPTTQALPIRNGNGNGHGSPAGPSNSKCRRDTAASQPAASQQGPGQYRPGQASSQQDNGEQGTPGAPGDPSKLPAFTGFSSRGPQAPQFPIGSQNVHGSDGPSASDRADAANGRSEGKANGQGTDDPGADSGQVTIPAAAAPEPRLPIFDSLESDWFRRSGQTMTTTTTTTRAPAGPQAAAEPWTSPADEGWRAAETVASPAAGETTQAGLPKRVPRANLVPGSVGSGGQETETEAPVRSPDVARSRMASFQRGVREGRAVAPQIEEP